MLIVTADHGEELFEDSAAVTAARCATSLVRVPLLVHDPSRFPGGHDRRRGRRGRRPLADDARRARASRVFDARRAQPLEPLAQGIGRGWPRPSYASMYEYAHAMRIGRWKMRVGKYGVPIVDDLVADPDEKKDFVEHRARSSGAC